MTAVLGPQFSRDARDVVDGVDDEGNLTFRQVDIAEVSFKGRFGALALSNTENTVSIGDKYFTIDQNEDDLFRVGDDVQITSLDDVSCYMWGEVIAKSTTVEPAELRVYVDDISKQIMTGTNWEIQVVARPKPGIEKDTSTTSIDPTGAGPFTFTVTASKYFPVGGKLLMKPTTDRTIALLGLVKAYSGTSLVVEKVHTNATVSTSYSSWAIALLDAPQNKLHITEIVGLRVAGSSSDVNDIHITRGRVRDSTDTVDLVLNIDLTKQLDAEWAAGTDQGAVVKVQLAGTISSSGTSVTGTGTAFLTDFGAAGGNSLGDLEDQADILALSGVSTATHPSFAPIISTSAATSTGIATTDTALTTGANLGAAAGTTYYRGGIARGSVVLSYAIVLARKDSDGSVDVFACSSRPAFADPDLPTGYTYYRILAVAEWDGTNAVNEHPLVVTQYLHNIHAPRDHEILVQDTGNVSDLRTFYEDFRAHLADTTDAHDASAISYNEEGEGGLTATDVQGAIEELADEKTNRVASTTDNAAVRFDSTAGAQQNSALIIADTTGALSRSGNGGIPVQGTNTNDSASAGHIGEYISSGVLLASAVALTTSVTANVTSISLTAGDWLVDGSVAFTPGVGTSITILSGGTSMTSLTFPTVGSPTTGAEFLHRNAAFVPNGAMVFAVPSARISIASTTTVYLVTFATFTVSTLVAYGHISARRVR